MLALNFESTARLLATTTSSNPGKSVFIKNRVIFLIALAANVLAAEKPNVIIILSDDVGYGDLGCYGQKLIQTPHLDHLAAGGMRFTNCTKTD